MVVELDDAPVVVEAVVLEVEPDDVPAVVLELLAPVVEVEPVAEVEVEELADEGPVLEPDPAVAVAVADPDVPELPLPTVLPHPTNTRKAKPIERTFTVTSRHAS